MRTNKLISYSMLFLVFLLFASSVYGLGIVPAEREVVYGGSDIEVRMKLMNPAGEQFDVVLYAEGDVAAFVRFDAPLVSFAQGEKEKVITYTVSLPDDIDAKGELTGKVTAIQVPKKSGATVSASIAISQTLRIQVPVSGKYTKLQLAAGDFERNKDGFFTVEVQNLGEEDLISASSLITIYGPLNNKVAVLPGDDLTLRSKEKKKFALHWTPTVGAGRYRAVFTLSDAEYTENIETSFSIGEPSLSVDSIDVGNFKLGSIAKMAIAITSNWNLPIDEAFAKVKVEDAAGNVYAEYKTAETYLDPFATQIVDAFWDTSSVLAGAYRLSVDLHYLGKNTIELFNITVEEDSITADRGITGQVTGEQGDNNNMMRIILLFLGLQTLLLIGFIIYRTKKNS